MLTTHLITKNNGATIDECLKSLIPLDGEILVGDRGSTDDTIEICRSHNARIIDLKSTDFSDVRNKLVALANNEWQFYLQPWEVLMSPFNVPLEPMAQNVQIINNNILTKEVRLWHRSLGLRFENPIFESIIDKNYGILEKNIIFTKMHEEDTSEQLEILEQWEKSCPVLATPHYYRAFVYLSQQKYNEFFNEGNKFLFHCDNKIPNVMMSYYMSLVRLYVYRDTNSIDTIAHCLAANLLMAEFWCLLGDVHYKKHQYRKAIALYENAILLGNQRLKSDSWPMDMTKYKKYPQKMIEECRKMIADTKLLQPMR